MTIRINALPDKLIAISGTTKIPTEDPSDESNKTKGVFIPSLIPSFQTPILQDINADNHSITNVDNLSCNGLIKIEKPTVASFDIVNLQDVSAIDLSHINSYGKNNILFTRITSFSKGNIPFNEFGRFEISLKQGGTLEPILEIDAEDEKVTIRNGYALEMLNSNILQATLVEPDIANYTNANHDHSDGTKGGTLVATNALTATGTPDTTTFLRGDNTWQTPPGAGGGEINTASNVGSFKEIFKQKVGTNLEFKTLAGVNDISITDLSSNEIQISVFKEGLHIDTLGIASDNTDLDATQAKHGLFSKLDKIKLDTFNSSETPFTWASSDEDSSLPPDNSILYVTEPADKDRTLTKLISGLKNAPTGSFVIVELEKETGVNTNVFSLVGLVTIDVNHFVSKDSTLPSSITTTSWEEGRRMRIKLATKDTNNAATGLKVTIVA